MLKCVEELEIDVSMASVKFETMGLNFGSHASFFGHSVFRCRCLM